MGRVLVTGGWGLIGSALVERLVTLGEQVTVFDSRAGGPPSHSAVSVDAIRWLRGNVHCSSDVDRIGGDSWDTVYHLAAQTDIRMSTRDPERDFEVNAVGTLRILQWARSVGVRRFVYPSTVAVYDPGSVMPLSESARVTPTSPYGASKLAGEALARAWGRTYDLEVVVVRLFNAYGPGMSKYVIHDLVRKLQADPRKLTILGTGKQVRDYLHVSDVASALELVARKAPRDELYNLGSGEPIRITDLADRIIAAMGLQNVEKVFTGESWPGDIPVWYADSSRLRGLGWSPQVSLQQGLLETVRWLRDHPQRADDRNAH